MPRLSAAICVLLPAIAMTVPVAAQDITGSWTSSQMLLNSEKEAWAAPECVDPAQWATDCDSQPSPPDQDAALRFTRSPELRRRNLDLLAESRKAADPVQGAEFEAILRAGALDAAEQRLSSLGLRPDDMADVMTFYVLDAWQVIAGESQPPSPVRIAALRAQLAQTASNVPAIVSAGDAMRQTLAEEMLAQTATIAAALRDNPGTPAEHARDMGPTLVDMVRTTVGFDFRTLQVTDSGLIPR